MTRRLSSPLYGDADPRNFPAYPIAEGAHYLNIPRSTLRAWVFGQSAAKGDRFLPVIRAADSNTRLLTFYNLVEAHILDALRRQHQISLQKVRQALHYLSKVEGDAHPLASNQFATVGYSLFVERYGNLVNLSKTGQMEVRELLIAYLRRVDRDDAGLPVRLFPYTRRKELDEPRMIVIDPLVSFGRPSVFGTGIPTAVIAERYKAGESVDDLASDYEVGRPTIEEAIRCELEAA